MNFGEVRSGSYGLTRTGAFVWGSSGWGLAVTVRTGGDEYGNGGAAVMVRIVQERCGNVLPGGAVKVGIVMLLKGEDFHVTGCFGSRGNIRRVGLRSGTIWNCTLGRGSAVVARTDGRGTAGCGSVMGGAVGLLSLGSDC